MKKQNHRILLTLSFVGILITTGCLNIRTMSKDEEKMIAGFGEAVASTASSSMEWAICNRSIREEHTFLHALSSDRPIMALEKELSASDDMDDETLTVLYKAFSVIDAYGKALSTIATGDYMSDIDKASEDLGKNLDDAVKLYNKESGANMSDEIGDYAAAAARALLGMHITCMRHKYLKAAIPKADIVISNICEAAVQRMLSPELAANYAKENTAMEIDLAISKRGVDVFGGAEAYYRWRMRVRDANKLLTDLIGSFNKMKSAHARLSESIVKNDFSTLKNALVDFKEEVDQANKIRKRLKEAAKQ